MKILVAEDDPVSRRILEGLLSGWGYECVAVASGDEAWRLLRGEDAPRLAILDWALPGLDGDQICQAVRSRPGDRYIYILLVTARSGKTDLVKGLAAGADDYLSKPYDPLELQARLLAGRRILDLQEQLIEAREALRLQATRDALTGAWNRRAILDILERELLRADREHKSVGVVLADLDHFKRINDTQGHLAGDAVLREVVRRMSEAVRPYDTVGRYGGEEFLIVLPGCDAANSGKLAERLREVVAAEPVAHAEGHIATTLSLGVVALGEPMPHNLHAVLQAADLALYRAKHKGRNRVEVGSFAETFARPGDAP